MLCYKDAHFDLEHAYVLVAEVPQRWSMGLGVLSPMVRLSTYQTEVETLTSSRHRGAWNLHGSLQLYSTKNPEGAAGGRLSNLCSIPFLRYRTHAVNFR